MGFKPYHTLTHSRDVENVPLMLQRFYAANDGVGIDSSADRSIRLCKLQEIARVQWSDLHIVGKHPPESGWEAFSGYRIAVSNFLDEIILVLNAPVCSSGSIITLGPDVAGPGGDGAHTLEYSLVLANDFDSWLDRLEQDQWIEYGLGPAGIADLPRPRAMVLKQHFHRLNPRISWA
jgi:hypothetical protein